MLGWIVRIVVLGMLAAGLVLGYRVVERERPCYWTNRCQERVSALWVHLEYYSVDHVIEIEKKTGAPSARRNFYPARLDDLPSGTGSRESSESVYRCPAFGLPYRYLSLDEGKSYLAYCPAQHRFHQGETPFVVAVMPDRRDLRLFVRGGKVYTVKASHPNPWDLGLPRLGFSTPGFEEEPVQGIPVEAIDMVKENPAPLSSW